MSRILVVEDEAHLAEGLRFNLEAEGYQVELVETGELQRWAYITCFSVCEPGQEDATYARMEKFIQSSVPQFQLVPGARTAGAAVLQTAAK